jgi:hypothetical protein
VLKEIAVFGKHRLAGTSYGPLTSSTEAEALAARRRALVSLHSRRAQFAGPSKALHSSLLAHPLCWSNRVRPPLAVPAADEVLHETSHADAAPQLAAPQPSAPRHAQRPIYVPAGSWNTYLPGGAPGLSRSHGPHRQHERP